MTCSPRTPGSSASGAATKQSREAATNRCGDISVKRIYQARRPYDGLRILVDRVWPRGLTSSAADLDEWCKDIAPSIALRRWYEHTVSRFPEFRDRYLNELDDPAHTEALSHLCTLTGEDRLTLLTANDLYTGHALVLAQRLSVPARRPPPWKDRLRAQRALSSCPPPASAPPFGGISSTFYPTGATLRILST
jgi:uncharacterized protein YeaO (DUF488 family)